MNGSLRGTIQVTQLLDVLRSGLAALVPVVERLAIPWTDGDAYDDWDQIASTLYEQLVVNTCRSAIEVGDMVDFARYDMIHPSYEPLAHFVVASQLTSDVLGVFVGFAGIDREFTRVKYAVCGSDGAIDTTTTRNVRFSECRIWLRLPGSKSRQVEVLTVAE